MYIMLSVLLAMIISTTCSQDDVQSRIKFFPAGSHPNSHVVQPAVCTPPYCTHPAAQENQQNWYLWNLYHQNKGKRKTDAVSYAQINDQIIKCEDCDNFCEVDTWDKSRKVSLIRVGTDLFYINPFPNPRDKGPENPLHKTINWLDAEKNCNKYFHSHLASIHSDKEWKELREAQKKAQSRAGQSSFGAHYFYGAKRNRYEWFWVDGSPMDWPIDWAANLHEPDKIETVLEYNVNDDGVKNKGGFWNMHKMNRKASYVCRISCHNK